MINLMVVTIILLYLINLVSSIHCCINSFNVYYFKNNQEIQLPSDGVPFLITAVLCSLINYLILLTSIQIQPKLCFVYYSNMQIIFSIFRVFIIFCFTIFIIKNLKMDMILERISYLILYFFILAFLFSAPNFISSLETTYHDQFNILGISFYFDFKINENINWFLLVSSIVFACYLYPIFIITLYKNQNQWPYRPVIYFFISFVFYFTINLASKLFGNNVYIGQFFALIIGSLILRLFLINSINKNILNQRVGFDLLNPGGE